MRFGGAVAALAGVAAAGGPSPDQAAGRTAAASAGLPWVVAATGRASPDQAVGRPVAAVSAAAVVTLPRAPGAGARVTTMACSRALPAADSGVCRSSATAAPPCTSTAVTSARVQCRAVSCISAGWTR